MTCTPCQFQQRIEEIEQDIKELQRDRNDSAVKYGKMETTLEYIKSAVDEMSKKINQLAEMPNKRYNTLITSLINGVVAAAIAAIVSMLIK